MNSQARLWFLAITLSSLVLPPTVAAKRPADIEPRLEPCKLISDQAIHNAPRLAKPPYLTPVTDPVFATQITRITGDPGTQVANIPGGIWGSVARHHYSKDQAWNADESLIFLDRNEAGGRGAPLFLDGETYRPLFSRRPPGGGEVRWHSSDPSLMVFAAENTLGTWNVRTGSMTPLAKFDGYEDLKIGPYEGNLSADGHLIVLTGRNRRGAPVMLVYDLKNGSSRAEIALSTVTKTLDWASISASGKFIVVNDDDDRTFILDYDGVVVSRFKEYGRPSHYDLALDASGEDIAVGVSKSPPDEGLVIARRLRDGASVVLTEAGFASHSSTRNIRRSGRGFSDFETTKTVRPYNGEIITYSLARGVVYRVAHHRNVVGDYLSETHASPSPTGDRVIFASDWGAREGRPVQAYVADFRGLCRGQLRP